MEVTLKMEPSVGRIVHYHCIDSEGYLNPGEDGLLAAVITRVFPESVMKAVNLIIFTNQPSGPIAMRTSIPYGINGGWSWPEIKIVPMGQQAAVKVATLPKVG